MPRSSRALRPLVPAFSAALVATVLTGVVATPAHADDYCEYEDTSQPDVYGFSPSKVTVGLEPALVTFHVSAYDECKITDWTVEGNTVLIFAYKSNPDERIYAFSNSDAGYSTVDVSASDERYNTSTERFGFRLLRKAYWSKFNASVPVRKGHRLTLSATLKRADWDADRYVGYRDSSHRVSVQFKAKGASSWKTVKTVAIGKGGRVSTTVKAGGSTGKDGSYRLSYAGNGVTGAATSGADYVDVR